MVSLDLELWKYELQNLKELGKFSYLWHRCPETAWVAFPKWKKIKILLVTVSKHSFLFMFFIIRLNCIFWDQAWTLSGGIFKTMKAHDFYNIV